MDPLVGATPLHLCVALARLELMELLLQVTLQSLQLALYPPFNPP